MILIDGKEWRPISFVDELIRAILADEKTETRRVIRGVPYYDHMGRPIMDWGLSACYVDEDGRAWLDVQTDIDDNSHTEIRCPYGKPGDFLWCRETFIALKVESFERFSQCQIKEADCVIFKDASMAWNKAKEAYKQFEISPGVMIPSASRIESGQLKWRPPMHLPFWAHRIGLEVTSIDIERVREITEDGAVREGFKLRTFASGAKYTARQQFEETWNCINGGRKEKTASKLLTWENNPFVWVVGFKRAKP